MSTNETFTPRQLSAARKALWHQDGTALLTQVSAREWLEQAGLVPYMPHTQQFPGPSPSFVEAILGRPEIGHRIPYVDENAEVAAPSEDESLAVEAEEAEENELEEGDTSATDSEIMVVEEDEAEEDEGDEIAEVDAIHAASEEAAAAEPAKSEPVMQIVSGFTAEQKEEARRMLARLVAEGAAVPLNLLGGPGELPDFVCSAQAFSFVYTLRGDKGWKLAPSTSGALRVSQLALHAWEILKEKGPLTAMALVPELGREVTEAAVLRAMTELWAIQRVIPLPQTDGSATVWELVTGKFIRHLKAGSNAGQPTALSALLSLYLGQVVAATTEEMEVFLSPLAARSRIREIVNGLGASRQLDEIVLEGKTLHYIAGDLPEFPDVMEPVMAPAAQQFSRYEPREKVVYPVRKPAGARAATEGNFANKRSGPRSDSERRPFVRRDAAEGDAPKREYTKPWNDDRSNSAPRKPWTPREGGDLKPYAPRPSYGAGGGDRPAFSDRKPYAPREGGERRPYSPRPSFGGSSDGGERKPYGDRKPFTPRDGGDRKSYAPRPSFGGSSDGGERRPYSSRPSFGGSGGGERKPFTPRDGGERRPYSPRPSFGGSREGGERPAFGDRKPFTPREGGERRPYSPRPSFGGSGGGERKPFTPRDGGERRPYSPRPTFGGSNEGGERKPYGDRKPFTPREGGERRPYSPRPSFGGSSDGGERRPYSPRPSFGGSGGGDRKPFTPRDGGDRKPYSPRSSFGGSGGGGERTPYARKPFTPREGGGGGDFEKRPFVKKSFGEGQDRSPKAFGERKFAAKKFGGKPGGFARKGGSFGGARTGAPKRRPE